MTSESRSKFFVGADVSQVAGHPPFMVLSCPFLFVFDPFLIFFGPVLSTIVLVVVVAAAAFCHLFCPGFVLHPPFLCCFILSRAPWRRTPVFVLSCFRSVNVFRRDRFPASFVVLFASLSSFFSFFLSLLPSIFLCHSPPIFQSFFGLFRPVSSFAGYHACCSCCSCRCCRCCSRHCCVH